MIPLSDSQRSHTFPWLVVLIIIINVYVFFVELSTPDLDGFFAQYALIPSLVNFGSLNSLYPFITSMFLHGGWLHIISNMLFLWVFGDNIEDAFGRVRFLLFYLVCGIAAGLTQYLINPSSDIPMLGASGAVAGVLGAYWSLYPNSRINTLVPLGFFLTHFEIPAGFMIGFWFLTQLLNGSASIADTAVTGDTGGVAFWAHIGGFVSGLILVRVFPPQKRTFWRVE